MASLFPIVGKNLTLDSLGTKKFLHTLPTQPALIKIKHDIDNDK